LREVLRRLRLAGPGGAAMVAVALAGFTSVFLAAQAATDASAAQSAPASSQSQPNQKDQGIPDAPSAVQPPKPPPENPMPPQGNPPAQPSQAPPGNQAPPRESAPQPRPVNPTTPPPINIREVPQGGATKEQATAQEQLFTLTKTVNYVMVPVTVKDESGHLVSGLVPQDFTVLEDGKKQSLKFFTSDPFALSAAVVLDLGMKDVDVQKVNRTFPALEGAFSEFDEVSIYGYSNAVSQISSWEAAGEKLSDALTGLEPVRGRNNGPPVTGGPLGPGGPTINDMPVDASQPSIYTPPTESHVMNDAILKAALDLAKRDRTRRKVIFVISDGREYRSNASYRDVLKVLQTNNIMVYAIGLGGLPVPGYGKLEKLHVPRFGYSDILPKYTNATGGEVFHELTRSGIEDAYIQAMGDARNQYTLGYLADAKVTGTYRSVEVLVAKPSCRSSVRPCVDVFARDGYYPMPPAR
jgi:VWFA-related protein